MPNHFLKYAATLFIICLAASGLLSVVHRVTYPKILQQTKAEEAQSLKDVFPSAGYFEPVKQGEDVLYYKAMEAGRLLGYVFKASKRGYSSEIVTMVGLDTQGVITKIRILSQNETPGLGTRVTEVIQKETLWDVFLKKSAPEKRSGALVPGAVFGQGLRRVGGVRGYDHRRDHHV